MMQEAGKGEIEVQVRFLGRFATLHPTSSVAVRLPEGSGLHSLLQKLEGTIGPSEAKRLEEAVSNGTLRLLINGRYTGVSDQRRLQTGDVVALASPVAGGQEIRRTR